MTRRPNTTSLGCSPKGGVGTAISFKCSGTFWPSSCGCGSSALDAPTRDCRQLSRRSPRRARRSTRSLGMLADSTQIESPAELHPYVARLPTGLHLLGAPAHAEVMAQMTPGLYSRLLDFLERFYEVVILDLGTGITDPLAKFAVDRADQTVVITTPEWVTAAGVLGAYALSPARTGDARAEPGADRPARRQPRRDRGQLPAPRRRDKRDDPVRRPPARDAGTPARTRCARSGSALGCRSRSSARRSRIKWI